MYKLLLILKYLRRKLAPMFAALAVTLCTAMVIIVISVMGGFLQMWRDSAKKLSGEVTISAGLAGFPNYEEMLAELRKHPDVESATAIIFTFGIVKIEGSVLKIEVVGIRPEELNNVVAFKESLHWTKERVAADIAKNEEKWGIGSRPAKYDAKQEHYRRLDLPDLVDAAMKLTPPAEWKTKLPGMLTGIAVYPGRRDKDGNFSLFENHTVGNEMTITVVPMSDSGGLLEQSVKKFIVVNDLKSGFIEFDQNRVYVPFDTLQQMLLMQPFPETDENNKPTGVMSPAKASSILVKGKPGTDLKQLKLSVRAAIDPVIRTWRFGPRIQTWEEQHATILGAVEKEKFLLVFLFAIISLVAFVMVATTFYNIVLEKTRDVGVLRALGASQAGIAGLFLGYGLAIGIVGACVGFALAWWVVSNLNEIQTFLEKDLGIAGYSMIYAAVGIVPAIALFIALGKWVKSSIGRWRGWAALAAPVALAGVGYLVLQSTPATLEYVRTNWSVKIWDAQIYYFDRIPAKLNGTEVVVIMIASVLSAVFGSLIPAIVAARLDPVEAIRYE
jgi:lipoprotein-releasing system permease protein